MKHSWSIKEEELLSSSLKDGVALTTLALLLPFRSSEAISRRAGSNKYNFRTQTINGVKKLFFGVKRRTRVATLKTSEVHTRINIKEADELIATTNSNTSAAVECFDNKSIESISSSNNKTNKGFYMFPEIISTNVRLQTNPGAGFTANYKTAFNIMDNFSEDLMTNVVTSLTLLENNPDEEVFEVISNSFQNKIDSFIKDHTKLLHSVEEKEINLYLQIFFNHILQMSEEFDIHNQGNFSDKFLQVELLWLMFKSTISDWIYSQRISDYKSVTRMNTNIDSDIRGILAYTKKSA